MKNNVVDQLREALEILTDFPHIDDVIDQGAAQKFLQKLSESEVTFAPSFKEVNPDVFIEESNNSIQEWEGELNRLEGVFAVVESRSPEEIIWGSADKYLNAKSELDEFYFCFERNNKAEFNGKEGTWEEVYSLIVKHVNDNLIVPKIPDKEQVVNKAGKLDSGNSLHKYMKDS